jgi:hypothetical protein
MEPVGLRSSHELSIPAPKQASCPDADTKVCAPSMVCREILKETAIFWSKTPMVCVMIFQSTNALSPHLLVVLSQIVDGYINNDVAHIISYITQFLRGKK